MGNKKKQNGKKASRKRDEDGPREDATPELPLPHLVADNGDAARLEHRAELRADVGRGTLAEQALAAIESAIGELERVYDEVAALGKSLALAREQLSEQEDELEAVREAALESTGSTEASL